VTRSVIIGFLAIIFLTESLFPNAEFVEFMKVPQLLKHYENHKRETPDITFVTFLQLHYGNSGHVQHDRADHSKLPFSKVNHHRVVTAIQVIPVLEDVRTSSEFTFLRTIEVVLYLGSKADRLSSGVWQPPRVG
jgi:hypothetical protein